MANTYNTHGRPDGLDESQLGREQSQEKRFSVEQDLARQNLTVQRASTENRVLGLMGKEMNAAPEERRFSAEAHSEHGASDHEHGHDHGQEHADHGHDHDAGHAHAEITVPQKPQNPNRFAGYKKMQTVGGIGIATVTAPAWAPALWYGVKSWAVSSGVPAVQGLGNAINTGLGYVPVAGPTLQSAASATTSGIGSFFGTSVPGYFGLSPIGLSSAVTGGAIAAGAIGGLASLGYVSNRLLMQKSPLGRAWRFLTWTDRPQEKTKGLRGNLWEGTRTAFWRLPVGLVTSPIRALGAMFTETNAKGETSLTFPGKKLVKKHGLKMALGGLLGGAVAVGTGGAAAALIPLGAAGAVAIDATHKEKNDGHGGHGGGHH